MKNKSYCKPHKYTPDELADAWKQDLLNDAKHSKEQAENGPFYPEKGITKESLLEYASECLQKAGQPIPKEFAYSKVG